MRNQIFDTPPDIPILFQDDYIVVINKPSGLLVHRSEIDKRETLFAMQLTRDTIGKKVYPIHRLDRPTSGVLVFALDSKTAASLCKQFAEHKVQKHYLAMVRGHVTAKQTIDYPLKRMLDLKFDKARVNTSNTELEAQEAVTELNPVATTELPFATGRYANTRYSLVQLSPKTGRKHQLRRHMAHLRHPIIGDTNHGDGKQNSSARTHLNLHRLALHAWSIEFIHPVSEQTIKIKAPLDYALNDVFQKCGWQLNVF